MRIRIRVFFLGNHHEILKKKPKKQPHRERNMIFPVLYTLDITRCRGRIYKICMKIRENKKQWDNNIWFRLWTRRQPKNVLFYLYAYFFFHTHNICITSRFCVEKFFSSSYYCYNKSTRRSIFPYIIF